MRNCRLTKMGKIIPRKDLTKAIQCVTDKQLHHHNQPKCCQHLKMYMKEKVPRRESPKRRKSSKLFKQ